MITMSSGISLIRVATEYYSENALEVLMNMNIYVNNVMPF